MTLALHGFPDWQRPFNTGDLSFTSGQQTLATNTGYTSSLLDMRPYSSFGASWDIRRGGVDANLREMRLSVGWQNDGFETGAIYEDGYSINAQNATAGGGACDNGILYVAGPVMGPYARIAMFNPTPVTLTGTIVLIGNSRHMPGMYAREVAAALSNTTSRTDRKLIAELIAVNNGATVLRALRLVVGKVWLRLETTTQPGTFAFTAADTSTVESIALAAGAISRTEMIFPTQSVALRITNTGAAPGNFRAVVIHQPDIW